MQASPNTILIADDEQILRFFMKVKLQNAGFDVVTARDGREGVDQFMAHQSRLALVISDVQMPHMNGFELARRINRIDPRIPIILTSSYRPTASTIGGHIDPERYLAKPFSGAELLAAVAKHALQTCQTVVHV